MNLIYALGSCLLVSAALSSCSLVGDAVDISSRRAKQVPAGAVIQGTGFSVGAPTGGLYPAKNVPLKGAVAFRPVEPLFDGQVFFVTPFSPKTGTDLKQVLHEWAQVPAQKGLAVTVTEQKSVTYQGRPAIEALVEVHGVGHGQVAAILVVKGSSGFIVLNSGENYHSQSDKANKVRVSKNGLTKLKAYTRVY